MKTNTRKEKGASVRQLFGSVKVGQSFGVESTSRTRRQKDYNRVPGGEEKGEINCRTTTKVNEGILRNHVGIERGRTAVMM